MENDNRTIKVMILKEGIFLQTIDHVVAIRIKSDRYNLLIMKDYWPVIGEIRGDVIIEGNDTYEFKNVNAFYSMSKNVFHLVIKSSLEENVR